MKGAALFAVVIGVVVGFLLGGMGPRRKLSEAEARIADLEKKVAEAQKRSRSTRPELFLPFPDMDRRLPAAPAPQAGAAPRPEGEEGEEAPTGTPDPEDARRAFELAADAQRVRVRQAKEALVQKANVGPKEMAEVERIIAEMNAKLKQYADEMADLVASGDEPDPRELLDVTHDVTGVLLEAQTAFEEQVGDGLAGLDDSSQQIWNYVDLETFREAFDRASEAGVAPQ